MENNTNNTCDTCNTRKVKKVIDKKRSKRIITIIALVAALGLAGAGIKKHIDSKPTYTLNEETKKNELNGTITFNQLNSGYKLYTLVDLSGEEKYVIGKKTLIGELYDLYNGVTYSFTGYTDVHVEKEESLDSYLVTLDYVQQVYDSTDIANIYDAIAEYKANGVSVEKTRTR